MRWLYRVLPALALFAFVSCGESAIFLAPVDEPADVRVETIDAGVILAPGSEVPLRVIRSSVFTGDPETADRLIVELLDVDGTLLGEQIYESVDQADELPALLLPELGDGLFILRTSYLDGDDLVATEDVPFFINGGQFVLLGLSSFPATLYPGSAGLLSLNLDVPFESDPYLEWYLDDDVIRTGFLSETGTTTEIQVPGKSRAYTVRVNLFPGLPLIGDVSVPAVITYSTELLVSTELLLDQSDLTPSRSYFVLHHFLGDLRNDGARGELFGSLLGGARSIGDPTLAVESDIFGYHLDGDDGFDLDGLILPVRDGRLTPFSLSFRLQPEELFDGAHLVSVDTGDRTILRLDIDADGRLDLGLEDGAAHVIGGERTVVAGVTSVITITILPLEEFTVVQFYVDGVNVLSEAVDWDPGEIVLPDPIAESDDGWMALAGSARIAGEGGFVGIIDEFGVYFRDEGDRPSPDTEIFHSAMVQLFGEKLVYAEGFEGSDLPDSIAFEGSAQIESGSLILGSGAAALFPVFGFNAEELLVTVSLDSLPGAQLRFYLGESDDLIAEIVPADVEATDLQFQFIHSDSVVLVDGPAGNGDRIELNPTVDFIGLRLEVLQDGSEPAAIAVESVVAWRENPEFPASLLEPSEEISAAAGDATTGEVSSEL